MTKHFFEKEPQDEKNEYFRDFLYLNLYSDENNFLFIEI